MKELSALALSVRASTTVEIDTKFKKMRSEGVDVLGFGIGEPDFNTPENIKEAAIQAIHDNQTRYTPAAGTPDMKKAVQHRIQANWGVDYALEEIAVTGGAKHMLYVILKTLVNPGDEVILPAPFWVSYQELIQMVGGVPVIVHTTADTGLTMTPDQLRAAVTPKTKALILNNPGNPTGMMYSRAALEEIAQICVEQDLYVISDEIYDKLIFDGQPHTCFPSLGEEVKARTILVNGVSKTYAMTGWRIGYAAGPKHIIKVISNYLSHCMSGPNTIAQMAAIEAFTGDQSSVDAMRAQFEARRDYLYERASAIPGIRPVRSQATFYMMLSLEELLGKTLYGVEIKDADDFANLFLEKGLVAVVPCTGFGAPEFIRWSFASSMENIKEGMDRLEKFLAEG